MKALSLPGLLVPFCLTVADGVPAADTYPIKLMRPAMVGQRYEVQVSASLGETTVNVVKGEARPLDRNLKVELTAAVQVLEVDAKGRELRSAYTVQKCEQRRDREETQVIAPGTVVTVANEGGRKQFLLKEGMLSAGARSSLDLVMNVHTGETDDDDLFGSNQPQPMGGTWVVDRTAALKALGQMFPGAQVGGLTGNATLAGRQRTNGVDCLEVTGKLQVAGLQLPALPNLDLTKASSEMRFMALLPADLSRGRQAERIEIDLSLNYTGRPGTERAETTLAHKREIRVERRFSYPPL